MDDTEFFKNLQKSSVSSIYLFGIDRNDDFHTFDLVNKKFSKKKQFCIQMQIFFMKKYFKWLDKRIMLEVLEKNDKTLSAQTENS